MADETPIPPATPPGDDATGSVPGAPVARAGEAGPGVVEEAPFESQLDSMKVRLEAFEGPLDLLLHLIRKNQVNIYDINLSLITEQYLQYIGLMEELNLDIAGEFLVMAATLIHIKSRMLLPRPETAATVDGDEFEEDPRESLVRRLLEHQRFQQAAGLLHEKETERASQFMRPDERVESIAGQEYEPELEVDLFSLLAAFKQVLERARERPPVMLPPEQIPIETRIEQLLERLSETEACGFEDLFADADTRGMMIVTFLAMLEMIRLKLIRVFQQGSLGPIRVYKRARPQDAPHPINDPEAVHRHHEDEQRQHAREQSERAQAEAEDAERQVEHDQAQAHDVAPDAHADEDVENEPDDENDEEPPSHS